MPEETAAAPISKPKKAAAAAKKGGGVDLGSIAGLAVAMLGIVGGLMLEGGKLRDVAQITAAMIVLGGTAGAVMVSMPLKTVGGALRRVKGVFFDSTLEP